MFWNWEWRWQRRRVVISNATYGLRGGRIVMMWWPQGHLTYSWSEKGRHRLWRTNGVPSVQDINSGLILMVISQLQTTQKETIKDNKDVQDVRHRVPDSLHLHADPVCPSRWPCPCPLPGIFWGGLWASVGASPAWLWWLRQQSSQFVSERNQKDC